MNVATVFVVTQDFTPYIAGDCARQLNELGYDAQFGGQLAHLEPNTMADFLNVQNADIFIIVETRPATAPDVRTGILLGAALSVGADIVFVGPVTSKLVFPHAKKFSNWIEAKEKYLERITTLRHTRKR